MNTSKKQGRYMYTPATAHLSESQKILATLDIELDKLAATADKICECTPSINAIAKNRNKDLLLHHGLLLDFKDRKLIDRSQHCTSVAVADLPSLGLSAVDKQSPFWDLLSSYTDLISDEPMTKAQVKHDTEHFIETKGPPGLKVNSEKCVLGVDRLLFLGHDVSAEGLSPNPERVAPIVNYPIPKTTSDLRRFLGMVNFYNRFIPKAAELQIELQTVIAGRPKKDKTPLQWTPELDSAFAALKTALSQATVLAHPSLDAPLSVSTDASDATLKCFPTNKWTSVLPLTLLGLRSALKEDIGASPAEIVYGQTLRLPADFIENSAALPVDANAFVVQLKEHMQKLRPTQTTHHGEPNVFVPAQLAEASHVFVRTDAVRTPLQPPYQGPFAVLKRSDKTFTVQMAGRKSTISIDRLKPAFFSPSELSSLPVPTTTKDPNPTSVSATPPAAQTSRRVTRSSTRSSAPSTTPPKGILRSSPRRQRKRESVSGSETDVSTSNENLSNEERYVIRHTARQEPQGQENHAYNTLIIKDDSWRHVDNPPPYKGSHNTAKQVIYDTGVREITEIPDDYLKQSQVLKHLAKEVKVCSSAESSGESEHHRPMSSGKHQSSRSARIRNKLSKSQPDLTALSVDQENKILVHSLGNTRKDQQRCAQMVDHLMQENTSLKNELEQCYQRVAKAQKLEDEVGKVTRAHEELVATCDRRERLESARIMRLQQEVRRLQETNQRLVAQHIMSGGLDKRGEAWVAQLVTQNKELLATKERQEIELAAQRATLQEQRTHIDILDTALINAQANVVRLEEENRQKQVHVERVAQLQRALSSLQLASDRREQTERKLRLQLEEELQAERARHSNRQENQGEGENLAELKKQLREKDEKIMWLEGEVAKWEQKYLEESQLRQAAIDAASIPKDAKIAALERTSQETEKLIAEARSDRIKQMDEVHAAQKKVTDLEAKVKELECKLAERDAMIRVLQKKHTLDKDVSSSYPSISLDTVPSLNTTDLNVLTADNLGTGVSTTSVFSTVSSALTSSTGFSSGASYSGSVNSSYHHKYSSPTESFHHRSLEGRLKELDTHLMGKRGLCCFPGFTHSGAASRKGKIPQPLLAGVTGFESASFLQGLVGSSSGAGGGGGGSSGRPTEDIALLEKQGLCSQQNRNSSDSRCASLPPSSLPRPKSRKARVSGGSGGSEKEKKCGEYGRLSDSEVPPRRGSESPARVVKLGDYGRLSSDRSSSSTTSTTAKAGAYSRLSGDSTEQPTNKTTEVRLSPLPRHKPMSSSSSQTPPQMLQKADMGQYSQSSNDHSSYSHKQEMPPYVQKQELPPYMQKQEIPQYNKIPVSRSFLPPPRKLSDYGQSVFTPKPPSTNTNLPHLVRRGSLNREHPSQLPGPPTKSAIPGPNKYRIQF
ncbi:Angiomotin C terminal [Nesidiocoris tenuis]|uniref:Angiomotin C terminal n=1 Tax=Nesidiocoris tenuis TaxID=355587 RepID=A0ABN7ANF3_9HEMI|nr:Angiomotin C terminal [Nesidiocoris tenuis]